MSSIDADAVRAAVPEAAGLGNETVAAWYLVIGWLDGVDPSEEFSTSYGNPPIYGVV